MFFWVHTHSSWLTPMRINHWVNVETSRAYISACPEFPADVYWGTGRPPQPHASRHVANHDSGCGQCASIPHVAHLQLCSSPSRMGLKSRAGEEWRKNVGWSDIKDMFWLLAESKTSAPPRKKQWENHCGCGKESVVGLAVLGISRPGVKGQGKCSHRSKAVPPPQPHHPYSDRKKNLHVFSNEKVMGFSPTF